jgi:protocatechuate 3,4-dioxygenase beta subunit
VSQKPATLHGTVNDQTTGAALEAVSVVAWHVDPAPVARVNTSTDAAGLYALSGLRPGRYWVFFAHSGYWRRVRILELPPEEVTPLDVQLAPR